MYTQQEGSMNTDDLIEPAKPTAWKQIRKRNIQSCLKEQEIGSSTIAGSYGFRQTGGFEYPETNVNQFQ